MDLSHCKLGDDGAKTVGAFLAQHNNRRLKTLHLANNNIGPSGLAGIVQGLLQNGSMPLQRLNLRLNPLRDEGGDHICSRMFLIYSFTFTPIASYIFPRLSWNREIVGAKCLCKNFRVFRSFRYLLHKWHEKISYRFSGLMLKGCDDHLLTCIIISLMFIIQELQWFLRDLFWIHLDFMMTPVIDPDLN